MGKFRIDNIRMQLKNIDLDGDGNSNEIEDVPSVRNDNVYYPKETTELGEALAQQNNDDVDQRGMSNVDFKARINTFQYAPIVAVDMIATMGVISRKSRDVVSHILRKSVSLDGKGREEFVKVVTGKIDNDIRKSGVQNVAGTTPTGK